MQSAGAGSYSAVAAWFEAHLRARQASVSQDVDTVVAWGPAMAPGLRTQLSMSADVHSKSSHYSGEDATSARQTDAADCRAPVASSAAEAQTPQARAAMGHCFSTRPSPPPKYQVSQPPAQSKPHPATGALPAKGATVSGECSPGRHDSRRSSSTMEGSGMEA